MLAKLRSAGVAEGVVAAMSRVRREDFVPRWFRHLAYQDSALVLDAAGESSISKPEVVAGMTHLLEVAQGMRIFELGTGSGYQAAILAELVGAEGQVVTMEIDPHLAEAARQRLRRYPQIEVRTGNGARPTIARGLDRILCTAAMPGDPVHLLALLKEQGILVAPVTRQPGRDPELTRYRGQRGVWTPERFVEVPFVRLRSKPSERRD